MEELIVISTAFFPEGAITPVAYYIEYMSRDEVKNRYI